MASCLVRSTPGRVALVRALAGDIVLCSWARHFTLTVPLSTQVYKWVPVNCWGNLANCGGVTCDGLASCPGEAKILLAASCYRHLTGISSGSYEPVLAPRLHFYLPLKQTLREILCWRDPLRGVEIYASFWFQNSRHNEY